MYSNIEPLKDTIPLSHKKKEKKKKKKKGRKGGEESPFRYLIRICDISNVSIGVNNIKSNPVNFINTESRMSIGVRS